MLVCFIHLRHTGLVGFSSMSSGSSNSPAARIQPKIRRAVCSTLLDDFDNARPVYSISLSDKLNNSRYYEKEVKTNIVLFFDYVPPYIKYGI